jgi:hypothetical protein
MKSYQHFLGQQLIQCRRRQQQSELLHQELMESWL